MSILSNSNSISIEDSTFTFDAEGDYSIDFTKSFVQVKLEGGQNTNLSDAAFFGVDQFDVSNLGSLSIKGLTFTDASAAADYKFEPDLNLDKLLSELIVEKGVAGTIEALTVNGSKADAFKLIWDHLDDNYSYYNTVVNDAFIDLGIAYAQYLKAGGTPLTDTIVKFAPDGDDADSLPERAQSLHDNLLGNLHELSIVDKFGAGAGGIIDRIQDAGLGAFIGEEGDYSDGRPIYGGYDTENPAATVAWDQNYFVTTDWLV